MTSLDSDDDGPSKRLGRKLREARIAAGYRNQQEFGVAMNMHRTTVTKIESGARQVGSDVLRQWCELCHVDFELYEASARLAWVTEASPVPVWFKDFFRAQVLAHTIRTWHPIIIPGPLQTPDYARALHEGAGIPDDLIEDRVAARIDLQQQTIERLRLSALSQSWTKPCYIGASGRKTSDTNSSRTSQSRGSGSTSGFRSCPRAGEPTPGTSARSPLRAWTTPT